MNSRMIGILVRKDLQLVRTPVLCYMLAGFGAVGLIGIEGQGMFYAGSVLLITALMALSFHPAMATTVAERRDHTMAFVMSLPITPAEYSLAKLLANLLMFFVPWVLLLASTLAMIALRPAMPDGLMPFATIMFGVVATSAVLIVFIGIVTESLQLTIGTQIASNLLFQAAMYSASNTPSIQSTMTGNTPVWNQAVLLFLGAEVALALLLLIATVWLQARKTDFI